MQDSPFAICGAAVAAVFLAGACGGALTGAAQKSPGYDERRLVERYAGGPLGEELKTVIECRSRLDVTPGDATLHAQMGRSLSLLDENPAARWHLTRAVRLAPHLAAAHYSLGVLHLRENEVEDAALAFRAAAQREPGFAPAHRDLGRALLALGEVAEGRAALREALRLAPEDVEALYQLGLALEEQDPERAATLLERATQLDPYHLGAHMNLAAIYRRQGRSADADRVHRRHRELAVLSDLGQLHAPEAPDRYLAEGRHYAKHEMWERATEVCAQGLARYPDHPELHFLLGMIRVHEGGAQLAQESYLRSLELRPGDQRVLEELASLYLGDDATDDRPVPSDDVRRAIGRAADLWPDAPKFRRALAALGAP